MSTPSRGRGGGAAKGVSTPNPRGRGNSTRGRGRGRATFSALAGAGAKGGGGGTGLLQKMRTGTVQRTGQDGATTSSRGRGSSPRGQPVVLRRGRGASSRKFNAASSDAPSPEVRTMSPAPTSSYRDFMAHMTNKFQALKPRRDAERKRAIQDGILADPDKKTSLANAITPVGTCTEMCPEFERVERIVQNMVDKAEKVANEASGRDMPSETRMIKRFRRSAAGYDEQLPSDIRTPETLRHTLDYLFDKVIGGGERLASIHKFVWDRTRGIRNDFSIQQVSKAQDVRIAVECFERIARFHILSLHQLSNPNNLLEGENFDAHQEREQLNNTLLSLMYYYDDNRHLIGLPNEPEFRAYCILFELQALTPDLEERMQSWPKQLLENPRVQTSFKIYAAAGNTIFDQGPLRPLVPFSIAQAHSARFWTLLASNEVSYMMACVAEMNFAMVRFTALDALWRSAKSAPQGQQQKNQEWTIGELTEHLGFDDDEQTIEFVQEFGLAFGMTSTGDQYLDITTTASTSLDKSLIPSQQIFSQEIVERKRYHRTLVAVMNGINVATAIRTGLVVESQVDEQEIQQHDSLANDQSMFIPDQPNTITNPFAPSQGSLLNPQATTFDPASFASSNQEKQSLKSVVGTKFGENSFSSSQQVAFGQPSSSFAPRSVENSQTSMVFSSSQNVFGQVSQGNTAPKSLENPFQGFNGLQQNATGNVPSTTATFTFDLAPTASTRKAEEPNVRSTSASQDLASPAVQLPKFQVSAAEESTLNRFANSNMQPASQMSTLFGEQSLKQPQTNSSVQQTPQVTSAQQSPLPTFDFARPSVQPVPAKPEHAPSIFTTPAVSSEPPVLQPDPKAGFNFLQASKPAVQNKANTPVAAQNSNLFTPAAASLPQPSTPLFNLAKPTGSLASESLTSLPSTTAKSEVGQTTTPLGSPRRPQLGSLNFSSFQQPQPLSPITSENKSQSISISPKTSTPSQVVNPLTKQPSPEPEVSAVITVDRAALAETTARIALTQAQGLIEYFVGHHVSTLLQDTVKKYQKDVHDTIISYVKKQYLARKYFFLWKNTTRRAALNRRGNQRRKLLAAAMHAELEKRKRNEQELESIVAATVETKKLQEEARTRRLSQNIGLPPQAGPVAGTKRKEPTKGTHGHLSSESTTGVEKSHKRSRTFGSFSESTTSTRLSSPSSNLLSSTAATRFGQSFFGQSSSLQSFRQSLTSHKVDSTKTDYFKLKAMGIDPETPLIPDTAKALALRQQRQHEERQALVSRLRKRDRSTSRASTPAQQFSDMPPPPRPLSTAVSSSPLRPVSSTSSVNDEDEFLKSLREAREAMSQDEEWFKTATASLETELQQQEELQKFQPSHSSITSRRSSTSGMGRVNGYEYFVADNKQNISLSRTERRIRMTGAHGLATRPIGSNAGSPTNQAGSLNSLAYTGNSRSREGSLLRASPARKREREDVEHVSPLGSRQADGQTGRYANKVTTDHATKRLRGVQSMEQDGKQARTNATNARNPSSNMFATLGDADSEDEEDEYEHEQYLINREEASDEADVESELEEEDDEVEDQPDEVIYQARAKANLQSMPEEELVEDSDENSSEYEEQEEDDNDNDSNAGYHRSKDNFAYSKISQDAMPTDSADISTFDQVGPGASADDALVLSD